MAAGDSRAAALAELPSVDRLLHAPAIAGLCAAHGREAVVAALRSELERLRRAALDAEGLRAAVAPAAIASALAARLAERSRPGLRPVYNLTGTVLHTNLGRALLPEEAVTAVVAAMRSPVNLEFDLDRGRRGERDLLIEELLTELVAAPAATVVNNNAAALVLVLNTLARRREVLVSRGELIEIGGSFRLPEIMQQAGVKLVEVGTTNRTHLGDYAAALTPKTALLLKVHPSNYAISGFTSEVDAAALATLARERGLPLVVDLGSGALLDLRRWQLPPEPQVAQVLAAGADLVTFSGDKLLGGPQAGLVVGRADLVARLRKSPLKRALRAGKLTLAALEAVLRLYRDPDTLAARLPTLALLTRAPAAIEAQALRLRPAVATALGADFEVEVRPLTSQVGSGALPLAELPSHGLAIRVAASARGRVSPEQLGRRLRALAQPVLGRIAGDTLWLDLRCLAEFEEAGFTATLATLAA